MEQQTERIEADNRKAKGRFLVVMLSCGLLGGVVGFVAVLLGTERLADLLETAGLGFSRHVAHWGALACVLLMLICFLPVYQRARRLLNGWDGEDEVVSGQVDELLSRALWVNQTLSIVLFFLVSASYAGVFGGDGKVWYWGFLLSALALIAGMVVMVAVQRRLVDLVRVMSPEKEGSVYDLNFQKKWMDSCDEAEKMLIGQCGYRAYVATQKLCGALWGIFALSGMFFHTGFLPCLAVCIIWGGTQWVYCHWSVKLSRPGNGAGSLPE